MNSEKIVQSFVNNFNYLAEDAKLLRSLANSPLHFNSFRRTKLCRTAILLLVLSLEALINRCLDHFIQGELRDFVLKREEKFSLIDKFQLISILSSGKEFDREKSPWGHLKELCQIRNDYVHPKHDRLAIYRINEKKEFDSLSLVQIPAGLEYEDSFGIKHKVKEKHLQYSYVKIPKDPYTLLPEHVDKINAAVKDIVVELDKLLDGKLTKDNWIGSDQLKIIYPPGSTF